MRGRALLLPGVLLAGWVLGAEGTVDLGARLQGPTPGHPFGTDELGRDLLVRFFLGGARSVTLGATLTAFHLVAGGGLALAAHGRPLARRALGALGDLLASIPAMLLALLMLALLRPGLGSLAAVLAVGGWIPYARIALTQLDALREDPSLRQVTLLGASPSWRIRRHVVPRLWPLLAAQAGAGMGAVILVEGGLGFLGLGLPPERATWGAMLAGGRTFLLVSPWGLLWPALGLVALLHALGEGTRDLFRAPGGVTMDP